MDIDSRFGILKLDIEPARGRYSASCGCGERDIAAKPRGGLGSIYLLIEACGAEPLTGRVISSGAGGRSALKPLSDGFGPGCTGLISIIALITG